MESRLIAAVAGLVGASLVAQSAYGQGAAAQLTTAGQVLVAGRTTPYLIHHLDCSTAAAAPSLKPMPRTTPKT